MVVRVRVRKVRGSPYSFVVYVRIPKRLWESLGRPKEFEVYVEGGKLIYKPVE